MREKEREIYRGGGTERVRERGAKTERGEHRERVRDKEREIYTSGGTERVRGRRRDGGGRTERVTERELVS